MKEGLSFGIVHSIVQDTAGVMWFATGDGLNRISTINLITNKIKNFGQSNGLQGTAGYNYIVLQPKQSVFSIQYTSLNYAYPEPAYGIEIGKMEMHLLILKNKRWKENALRKSNAGCRFQGRKSRLLTTNWNKTRGISMLSC